MNRKQRRFAMSVPSASKSEAKCPTHYRNKRSAARKARKFASKQR